jgi:hypothetical protein
MATRPVNLQCAADDIGVIAETVDTLSKLLDHFYERHDDRLRGRLEEAWPQMSKIDSTLSRRLYALERALTPSED